MVTICHRLFVPEHVRLTTYTWTFVCLLLVATSSTAAAAAPPAVQPPATFETYMASGDRALALKRWSLAQENYEKALAIRYDAAVLGRLGLVRRGLGDDEGAAGLLYRALNDFSARLSKSDWDRFSAALRELQGVVCRVGINVDRTDEQLEIEIDGVVRSKGRATFWLFLKPGTHVIRARLSGMHDAITSIITERDCPRNVVVDLHLEPISPPAFIVKDAYGEQATALVKKSRALLKQSESLVAEWTLYAAKPPPNPVNSRGKRKFVVGFGAWIPFGATPGWALGGQLHAGWRSSSWWELGGDLRWATTMGSSRIPAGSAFTWAVAFTPCGWVRAHRDGDLFGCALVQMSGGAFAAQTSWVSPAFGGRAGYEFHLKERFQLGAFVDVVGYVVTPDYIVHGETIWTGKRLQLAFGVRFVHFF